MNVILPTRLTIKEFLRWSLEQQRGRYELVDGRIVAMGAETATHAKTRIRLCNALMATVERSGQPVYALPDGMTVPIAEGRAYEPDALIAPLPEIAGDAMEVANPIVVFEILSPTPTSQRRDFTEKVEGYSRVATILHYVIIDPEERLALHYRREGNVLMPPVAPSEGRVRLDPPGLELALADVFPPEPGA